MKKIYVLDRDSLDFGYFEYETEEEREEKYEEYDNSPMICGTLFLTEEEYETLKHKIPTRWD